MLKRWDGKHTVAVEEEDIKLVYEGIDAGLVAAQVFGGGHAS